MGGSVLCKALQKFWMEMVVNIMLLKEQDMADLDKYSKTLPINITHEDLKGFKNYRSEYFVTAYITEIKYYNKVKYRYED